MGQGLFNAPRAVPTDTEPEPEDGLQLSLFDYGSLDEGTRAEVQQRTTEIKALVRRSAQDIVDIGSKLIDVKERLGHGKFGEWLEAEFGWTDRTAQRFMQVADKFGKNRQIVGFAPSALYLLAAPSTPDEVREEAMRRAESGEAITHRLAQTLVEQAKPLGERLIDTTREELADPARLNYIHAPTEIASSGYIQPGEEQEAVHIKSEIHRQLASHQLINQSTNNEWYTPAPYIEAVREVLGGIDTDPASNPFANQTIRATTYYTAEQDGFSKPWAGRVFLNPPYGFGDDNESNQARWSKRLIEQFQSGITTEAILLVNAVPGNKWFAPLWNYTICFPDHRIRFYNEAVEAGQPTHSNAFIYFGPNRDTFARVFARFGVVAVRYEVPDAARV